MFICNVPAISVFVSEKFLGSGDGFEKAYLVAATSIPSRPLFFAVHLESGALWQRVPVSEIFCTRFTEKMVPLFVCEDLQPYSCLEGQIACISYQHLAHYEVKAKIKDEWVLGNYLFTIDVMGQGLAEDPEQHKTHNIIALKSGQLAALPNNYLLFQDDYFTEEKKNLGYKRNSKFYLAGG